MVDLGGEILSRARYSLGRDFTEEHPKTNIVSAVFRTTRDIFDSEIKKNSLGFYEEVVSKRYEGDEMYDKMEEMARKAMNIAWNFDSDEIEVVATSNRFTNNETKRLLFEDMKYVGIVVCFCIAYMTFHSGSFFIAVCSLINVTMSIPVAMVIFNLVLRVSYFASLHIAVLVVIIGIGSDDIFVFHDFWKNTFQYKAIKNKPILRISLAFRQASQTMLLTSLTSTMAFLSTSISEIMPLRSFGIFAALIVPIVFFQTIVVQPLIYFIYEIYVLKCWKKFKRGKDGVETIEEEPDLTQEPLEVLEHGDPKLNYQDYQKLKTDSKIEQFFEEKVSDLLQRYKYIFIGVGSLIFALNVWSTINIPVRNVPETILKASHPLTKAAIWGGQEIFLENTYGMDVVFGVKE